MKNVDDIYPLSPLQQGLLFHTLSHHQQGMYFEQSSFMLDGDLNIDAFRQAWQTVLERHSILRTAFLWEGLENPLQVVRQQVKLPWNQEDWRNLPHPEQQERIQTYLKDDRERGFNLTKAPLLRLALFRLGEETYHFTWSHHHILLDGWSVAILSQEVFELYAAFEQGQAPLFKPVRPYRDFIAWLQKQKSNQAETFWRDRLTGYMAPLSLTIDAGTMATDEHESTSQGIHQVDLSAALTSAIQTFVRQHQLTLNTLLRAAWAVILAHYSGERDVIFGTVSSGRPESLSGSETMIGMFVNTLPVRVQVNLDQPLIAWLKTIQADQLEANEFEHTPLVQVQGWSEVPNEQPLFENLLIVENYRVEKSQHLSPGRIRIQPKDSFERANYPLGLLVLPGERLGLQAHYDLGRFAHADIIQMLDLCQTLLDEIVLQKPDTLADLPLVKAGTLHLGTANQVWIQNAPIDLSKIKAAITNDPRIDDCTVLARRTKKAGSQLIAYMVSSNSISADEIQTSLKALLPANHIPHAYTFLTRLPLLASGALDEAALRRIPIIDADLAMQWEDRLRLIPQVGQAAALVHTQTTPLPHLHLSDLLPNWKNVLTVEGARPSSAPTLAMDERQPAPSQAPSISHGKALLQSEAFPTNLGDILRRAAQQAPQRGALFLQEDGRDVFIPYPDLLKDAEQVLAGLRRLGVKPQDKVLLQLDLGQDFITAFWGCVLGGIIPVPVTIAPTYEQRNSALNKLVAAWQMLHNPIILTSSSLLPALQGLNEMLQVNFQVESIDELRLNPPDHDHHPSQPDDLALLLLTSGSTGAPKAVMQKHRSILHHSASVIQENGLTDADISINWMPLDHVGGIIMFHIMEVYLACQQVHAPINLVLQQPLLWLDWIQAHRATFTWAPNFAYGLINARAEEIAQRAWDLSSMKLMVNGGEVIVPKTARTFLKLLVPHGLPATAMCPSWGMSETCSGATFSTAFTLSTTTDEDIFVELGGPMPGFSIRIVDAENQVLPEGITGRYQVKGLTLTDGYYENPEQNQEAFTADGWFSTGDLALLRNGRLTITGREKDVIIINGVNYYSHEIEAVVDEMEGIEASFTAACAVRMPGNDTDSLAIFFSPSAMDDSNCIQLIKTIRKKVVQNLGVNPAFLVPVEKEAIPKTQIGKIQRAQLRKSFEKGDFDPILKRIDVLSANPNTLPDWFFRKVWRKKQLFHTPAAYQKTGALIFMDELGLGESLSSELRKQDQNVIIVESGAAFKKIDRLYYQLDVKNRAHYQLLIDSLSRDGLQMELVFHLGMYSAFLGECSSLQTLENAQASGLYSLLFLVQAIHKHNTTGRPVRLMVAASHTQSVLSADLVAYEKASVLGFLKSAVQEIPWLICRHLDLETVSVDDAAVQLAEEIGFSAKDAEVAYRTGERYLWRLEKADLSKNHGSQLPFKTGGMYLISGGLGGIATGIASYLLQQFHARLLLVGRTSLPERSQWNDVAQENGAVTEKIRAYQALETLNGEICYVAGDVADPDQMRMIVEQQKSRWGCDLDGIIHLAGTSQQSLLLETTPESFAAVLRPKLAGTWVLQQLLEDRPDQLFISFSSVNGSFGGAMDSGYAAANSFMDAFSDYQNKHCSYPSYCFAWSMWDELGMSRNYPLKERFIARGYHAISASQGLNSFLAGLCQPPGFLLIGLNASNLHTQIHMESSPLTSQTLRGYFTSTAATEVLSQSQEDPVVDRFGGRVPYTLIPLEEMPITNDGTIDRLALAGLKTSGSHNETPYLAPRTEIERRIVSIWQTVLKKETIGVGDNFFELGGHSLLMLQAHSRLHEAFSTKLSIVELFRYPTVSALARYLSQELEEKSSPPAQNQLKVEGVSPRQQSSKTAEHEIAVIGMAGRFPGARNVDEFWKNLSNGVESVSFFSKAELKEAGVSAHFYDDANYVRARAIIDEPDLFDAFFFGYTPREAEIMDPQHRLLLECAWEALENAAFDSEQSDARVGVFAGTSLNTYLLNSMMTHPKLLETLGGHQALISNDRDFLTTRISYKLNLTGPSVNIQTACSTSLVAVHMACQSLRAGECDMALAGGVSVVVPQKTGYLFQEGNIYSPDGHCRAFDAKGQGIVGGDGVGLVVLKRLSQALTDGDPILAVIKGSAINNDGAQKVGYTAPSVDGQAAVIRDALALANVDASAISYVETHGTATQLGDPIELAALTRAFQASPETRQTCAIGSLKTNIGHLDAAAGVAGLIKTILALQNNQIPPSLHYERPNPQIDFAKSPFYVNTHLREWKRTTEPRRAGVSSFGIGGTNAHAILEEAPIVSNSGPSRPWQLLVLSAKSETALDSATRNLAEHLKNHPDLQLSDVTHTLQVGRRAMEHRRMLVCRDRVETIDALSSLAPNRVFTVFQTQRDRPVVFLFPGQGAQYINMSLGLYQSEPFFRQQIDLCCDLLAPRLGMDLRSVLYPVDGEEKLAAQRLNQTDLTQPALFVIEYALAQLWMSWGVKADAMIGHSLGEYVAACLAGVFSLDDALTLVAARGRLMQSLPGGAMLSVALSPDALKPYLGGSLSLAAVNAPTLCVISGSAQEIEALQNRLSEQKIECRRLHTSHAFHSSMMDPILDAFADEVQKIHLQAPRLSYISNLTGTWMTPSDATDPIYWVRHLRQAVRFGEGMQLLLKEQDWLLLELGPGQTLTSLARLQPGAVGRLMVSSLRHPQSVEPDLAYLLDALGQLWLNGVKIDWTGFYAQEQRQRVVLPTYPFERQRYWIIPSSTAAHPRQPRTIHDGQKELTATTTSKDSLSLHGRPKLRQAYTAPGTQLELTLESIWQDVLGIESIGIHDNFFELGGHSLMATQLHSRVRANFNLELPLRILFESPTIHGLAQQIEAFQALPSVPAAKPILPVSRQSSIPLSFAQTRLWFLDQLEPGMTAYHLPFALRLIGPLNIEVLEQSLNTVVQRHEVLRTNFIETEGQIQQVIVSHRHIDLLLTDLQSLASEKRQAVAQQIAHTENQQPFNLADGPLLRARIVRLANDDHVLLFTLHHIVADGWSMRVFVQEVTALYTAFSAGQPSPLPDLPIQYADYAAWQNQWLQGETRKTYLDYWLKQLADVPTMLALPTDRPRPSVQTYHGAVHPISLSKHLTLALQTLNQQEGTTLFMILLAAFQVFLSRYTGQNDLVVGSPIANRNHAETEALIGFFINTLVLRGDLNGNPSFREYLGRVRETALGAYAYQDLPFEQLVEALQPERDTSRSPLFQVMFTLQNTPPQSMHLPELSLHAFPLENRSAQFDLSLSLEENEDGLTGTMEYNTDLFDQATVERMAKHFTNLLEAIIAKPDVRIQDMPILGTDELQQLLVAWNATEAEYPKDRCIHELFETQVQKNPEAVAVIFQDQQLTYTELNERANQVAHYLSSLKVEPDVLVGICLERSIEMLVGLLGVLKAGGAYVPLDPSYPKERLAYMLEDAGISILITQERLLDSLPRHTAKTICLDNDWQTSIACQPVTNIGSRTLPENLAYIIYTSGSTGKPKGTMIVHSGLTNYLTWCKQAYPLHTGQGAPVHSSISFDLTITGLFAPLTMGRPVHMLPENLGAETLSSVINTEKDFSLIKITPAHLKLLGEQLPIIKASHCTQAFIIGGENLQPNHIEFWQAHAPQTLLINEYGPTETVVGCCVYIAQPGDSSRSGVLPIGRPILNVQIYILDRDLNPVPVGVPGELHIAGEGLARGYLNRPDLSAEKFIPNPFSSIPGARMYKSGDLAKYHPDGNIECLGRIDHQVKIRGFRVELGEIEAALANLPEISDVSVLAHETTPGDKRLVAYLVLNTGHDLPGLSELRNKLSQSMPEYMLPTHFIQLEQLPLTPNGKIDRKALPAPDMPRSEADYVAPSTPIEEALAQIWAEALKLDKIGIHDNFFELGGHSLLVAQVAGRIRGIIGQNIPLVAFFHHPTVYTLAQYLRPNAVDSETDQTANYLGEKRKQGKNRQEELQKRRQRTAQSTSKDTDSNG